MSEHELSGRIALVTGSTGGGIGRSIALTLARDGADLVLNYGTQRRGEDVARGAEAVAEAIRAMGCRALVVEADTADAGAVDAMVAAATEALGPIDILVNNAGGAWEMNDLVDVPPERFLRVLQAETMGALHCIQACLPHMRAQRWGRIVSLGMWDVGHWAGEGGLPVDYGIGKAGRALLTRHLALQERVHNITVNLINPGPGHTGPIESLDAALELARHAPQWAARAQATPQDMAEAVRYLCSEAARFVTGSHISFSVS